MNEKDVEYLLKHLEYLVNLCIEIRNEHGKGTSYLQGRQDAYEEIRKKIDILYNL